MYILEYVFMVRIGICCYFIDYFVVFDLFIGNWYLNIEIVGIKLVVIF